MSEKLAVMFAMNVFLSSRSDEAEKVCNLLISRTDSGNKFALKLASNCL